MSFFRLPFFMYWTLTVVLFFFFSFLALVYISSAQSKWVTEKLCQIAARTTPMYTAVLRTYLVLYEGDFTRMIDDDVSHGSFSSTGIGQMVGDTTNGIWNESEGISLIFKVSVHSNFARSCL